MTEVAKSIETIVWTDKTRGVAKPANTKATVSYLDQVFAAPFQPKLKAPYTDAEIVLPAFTALSLIVAKSGINPIYQKTKETEK